MKKIYIAVASLSLITLLVVGIVNADTRPTTGGIPTAIHKPVTDSSDISILRSIYQEFVDPQSRNGCTVDFIATSVYRNIEGELDTTQVRCSYAASASRMQFITDSLSVYSDSAQMIAVLPARKELYLSSLDNLDYKDVKRHMVGMALASMFEKGKVLETTTISPARGSIASNSEEGTADTKIVIEPGSEIISRIGARRITIVFNRKGRALRDVLVEFAPDIRTQSTRIQYGEFKWNQLPESFSTPLISQFFNDGMELRPRYRGYTVKDKRSAKAAGL